LIEVRPAEIDYDIDEQEPPADECDRAWSTLDDERQPFDSDNDIAFESQNNSAGQQRQDEGRF
jgi:hypothetical protein